MPAIVAKMNARVRAEIPEAFVAVFPPPPVSGIGNAGGYRLFIQDRGNAGLEELQTQAFAMMMKANQTPGLTNNLTTFRANVPQLWLDVDRVKAKSMNVPLSNIFGTLQTYLGSSLRERPHPLRPQLSRDRAGRFRISPSSRQTSAC